MCYHRYGDRPILELLEVKLVTSNPALSMLRDERVEAGEGGN